MSDENIIYYNMALTNTSEYPIPANISDTRSSPILRVPEDYEVSVVRFQINANFIPLFYPVIPDPVGAPLVTNMSITLQYAGLNYREFLNVEVTEAKYGVYNFGVYLDHLNVASGLAFTALKAANPGASGTVPPLFYLDTVTGLISMYVQDSYLETNVNRIRIGFNQDLEQVMNLPISVFNGYTGVGGFDAEVAVRDLGVLLPVAPRAGYPVGLSGLAGNILQISQEFQSLSLWNFIKSITFTTSMLPVVEEMAPNTFSIRQNTTVNSGVNQILTDFDLNKENIDRNIIQYLPTAEYRMISLVGKAAFNKINVNVSYEDYMGVSRPVLLQKNTCGSLKLLFRRKEKR